MSADTTTWTRRAALGCGAAALAAQAAAAADLTPTGAMTRGPFYPDAQPEERDADLVRVAGADAAALGEIVHVQGRLLAADGSPIAGGVVELWHCDAAGVYRHPRERRGPVDSGFQGYGSVRTDADGAFAFRTIKPGVYPGRARHFHVQAAAADGRSRASQWFFAADAEANARDFLFQRLSAAEREIAVLTLGDGAAIEAGARRAEAVFVLA